MAPSYPALRNALSELDSECTRTTDFSYVFDDVSESIFYDIGHMGDSGNIIVAKNLFELSKSVVLQKLE